MNSVSPGGKGQVSGGHTKETEDWTGEGRDSEGGRTGHGLEGMRRWSRGEMATVAAGSPGPGPGVLGADNLGGQEGTRVWRG